MPGVRRSALSSSITMDGNDSNDPIWAEDMPAPKGRCRSSAATSGSRRATSRRMGNPLVAGRDITWDDVHTRSAGGRDRQREPGARVLGRAGGGHRPAHPQQPQEPVARNRRRGRRRAGRRRDAAGAGDRLLADGDERLLGHEPLSCSGRMATPSARRGVRTPNFLQRGAAGGLERQSEPAAGAGLDAAGSSTTLDGARPPSRW